MKTTFSLATLAAACVLLAHPAQAADAALNALAEGGHAIVMRHARISGHARAAVLDPKGDCANEENLSAEGRAQAQRLKSMLDKAGVGFDTVLTSPFCRAKDTARLAFGRASVDPNLTALELGTPEQARARTRAITEVLAAHAGKGNVALVTHRPNIDELTMELVGEGEALVAKIQPGGSLHVVGRIIP